MRRWFSIHRETGGNVAIITALSIGLLIAVGGSAIDFGRYELVRLRVQQAVSAAAIATAAMPDKKSDGTSYSADEKRQTVARYFAINYPVNYLGVAVEPGVVAGAASFADNKVSIDLKNLRLNTIFLQSIGVDHFPVSAFAEVQATNNSNSTPYDIIFLFDNSGSMATPDAGGGKTRFKALQESALTMTNNLLSPNVSDSKIAAVAWGIVVMGKQNFTGDVAPMINFINTMNPNGTGTDSTVGLAEAQNMAPQFRSNSVHAIILLTDGQNNQPWYNTNSLVICNQFKTMSPQTFVYTIALGGDIYTDTTAKNFLSSCASGVAGANTNSYFFIAPDSATLDTVFKAITTSIKKIKITK